MPHHTPLIATIVLGLVLAFILGAVANRIRISPLVGYLLAGVAVGPYTPGFVADQSLANELAEIGVILLMFGVGMHFSLKDLLSVKAIAIPGAVAQIAVATLLGLGLALLLDWPVGAGVVFGLALSVASTVVLLRALQERRLLDSKQGRIAVGWLIVEDLAMVLALVMLPAVAGLLAPEPDGVTAAPNWQDILTALAITLGKVGAFIALMLVVGRRVIPWLLHYIAHTGSRELFRLAVLAIGLGVAYGATELFGVSFALGAFFAGMVLSESELSHRAAEETLPLRDAFAVLFFVSVGMLFDPTVLLTDTWPILGTVAIIMVGKSVAAFLIVRLFRHPLSVAMTISASLAQIGEFSFILAALGVSLGILPEDARDLILAGAILSILANPLFFIALDRLTEWMTRRDGQDAPEGAEAAQEPAEVPTTTLTGHAVIVGFGRVGSLVAEGFRQAGRPLLVVEERDDLVAKARDQGLEVLAANAAQPLVLKAANLPAARWLIVAIPNAFEAANILTQARAANPGLEIIARAHSDVEVDYLGQHGANRIVMGEREIARAMLEQALAPVPGSPPPAPPAPPPSSGQTPPEPDGPLPAPA